jgi:hypothetical protein
MKKKMILSMCSNLLGNWVCGFCPPSRRKLDEDLPCTVSYESIILEDEVRARLGCQEHRSQNWTISGVGYMKQGRGSISR